MVSLDIYIVKLSYQKNITTKHMENKQTAVDILFNEIKDSEAFLPDNLFEYLESVYNKTKEIEADREFETKAFWFGRGILAGKEDRIKELKPTKDGEE